jgi:hypothetical protein
MFGTMGSNRRQKRGQGGCFSAVTDETPLSRQVLLDALRRPDGVANLCKQEADWPGARELGGGIRSALSGVRLARTPREQTSAVDSLSAMVDPAGRGVESKVVAAVVGRLVVLSSNRFTAQTAQQQRSNTAVRDNCNVAAAGGFVSEVMETEVTSRRQEPQPCNVGPRRWPMLPADTADR